MCANHLYEDLQERAEPLTWAFCQAAGSACSAVYRLNRRMDFTASPTASWEAPLVSQPSSTFVSPEDRAQKQPEALINNLPSIRHPAHVTRRA